MIYEGSTQQKPVCFLSVTYLYRQWFINHFIGQSDEDKPKQ